MKLKPKILILLLGALLLASCAAMSFEGDYVVRSGETLRGNIFATSGSVTLQENSRVTGTVFLTSGELRIGRDAQIGGDVVLTSGAIIMAEGAVVYGDVILSSQDIDVKQAPGSIVEGQISYNIAPFVVSTVTKGFLLFCVLPFVLLVALLLVLGVWLGRSSKRKPQGVSAPTSSVSGDPQQMLKKLKEMLDQDLITETDYEAKKEEILAKM